MRLILFLLFVSSAIAQTDYMYMVSSHEVNRKFYATCLNSRSFREVPGSPYLFEPSDQDLGFFVQNSLSITDPGPYTYATRNNPNQVYGYRREIDGQLTPLPGSPLTWPTVPGTNGYGFSWLEKHPLLPIIYGVSFAQFQIRVMSIASNGSLSELPNSILTPSGGLGRGPWTMEVEPSGHFAFVTSSLASAGFRGIIRVDLDPATGRFGATHQAAVIPEGALGLMMSLDGQYLYATAYEQPRTKVYGYKIQGQNLELLPQFPRDFPLDPIYLWPHPDGQTVAMGGYEIQKVGLWTIAPDGDLIAAPGSPQPIHGWQNVFAGFSPRGDRVFYGGNTLMYAFDIGPNLELTNHPNSPIRFESINFGVTIAPEIRGDPYSLAFEPAAIGDQELVIRGDPATPFYLEIGPECLGPFLTDESGVYRYSLPVTPDMGITIKAYCDESIAADYLLTVPTLTPTALLVLMATLLVAGGWALHFRRI